jgi:hypothetical protein
MVHCWLLEHSNYKFSRTTLNKRCVLFDKVQGQRTQLDATLQNFIYKAPKDLERMYKGIRKRKKGEVPRTSSSELKPDVKNLSMSSQLPLTSSLWVPTMEPTTQERRVPSFLKGVQ